MKTDQKEYEVIYEEVTHHSFNVDAGSLDLVSDEFEYQVCEGGLDFSYGIPVSGSIIYVTDEEGVRHKFGDSYSDLQIAAKENRRRAPLSESDGSLAEFTGQLIDIFEDFLEERGIAIDNPEKEEALSGLDPENTAIIYGSDYGELQSEIESQLENWRMLEREDSGEDPKDVPDKPCDPPCFGKWTDIRKCLPDHGDTAIILDNEWNVGVSCVLTRTEIIPLNIIAWMPLPPYPAKEVLPGFSWTLVDTAQPAESGKYLIEDSEGDMLDMKYSTDEGWLLFDKYPNEVVAWMPLPSPNFPF